jgi:5S rRNA maturation endonuclease (ribonuclease M5)
MDPQERLDRLERALALLAELSHAAPVLVEGAHDLEALRELGVDGEILVYNRGGRMTDLADRLRARPLVIVLFDWDRKGGHLTRLLKEQLGGVRLDLDVRKELATVSLVRCVEDLPHAKAALERRLERRAPP